MFLSVVKTTSHLYDSYIFANDGSKIYIAKADKALRISRLYYVNLDISSADARYVTVVQI